jgi:hypothetical protein
MADTQWSRRQLLQRFAVGAGALGLGIGSVGSAAANNGPATVTLNDQDARGVTVNVDSVYLPKGGFVVIHDDRLLSGKPLESVVGNTAYKNPGTYEDLRIPVDPQQVSEGDNLLIAMPHRNTNRRRKYDFVTSDGKQDPPYVDPDDTNEDGKKVVIDPAMVTF